MSNPTPIPEFNRAIAKLVVGGYRHAASGRTIYFHQPADDGALHLFSATFQFIATAAKAALPDEVAAAEATLAAAEETAKQPAMPPAPATPPATADTPAPAAQ